MPKQYSLFIYFIISACILNGEKAVVVVPIADLVGDQLHKQATHTYDNLALCGGSHRFNNSCPRIHQLLFNEMVDVLEYRNGEVRVAITNLYYCLANSTAKQTSYWTAAKNIKPLSKLKRMGCPGNAIPLPISFEQPHADDPYVITLVAPFFDGATKQTYSAGTRFRLVDGAQPADQYTVHIFDQTTWQCIVQTIPKSLCFYAYKKTNAEKVAAFVTVLRTWARQTNGFIPYVWGGCSFTHRYANEPFTEQTHATGSSMSYTQTDAATPKTGFDCSNIIARAAQIAGIPYWFKNTTTVAQSLMPVNATTDSVQAGDIIWIPGHVMIVSDAKKNMVIEASSYKNGTGRVQEVPLSTLFFGVKTYKELLKMQGQNKTVQRVNTLTGKKEEAHIPFKIFAMASAWTV